MSQRFTKLNKYALGVIGDSIVVALKSVEREMGIKLEFKGGRFQDKSATLKLEVVLVQEDGTAFSQIEEDFKTCCSRYGIEPSDLGRPFTSNGEHFKLTGLKPQNHRYPFIAERRDGKQYKFSASFIRTLLGKNVDVLNVLMTAFGG